MIVPSAGAVVAVESAVVQVRCRRRMDTASPSELQDEGSQIRCRRSTVFIFADDPGLWIFLNIVLNAVEIPSEPAIHHLERRRTTVASLMKKDLMRKSFFLCSLIMRTLCSGITFQSLNAWAISNAAFIGFMSFR